MSILEDKIDKMSEDITDIKVKMGQLIVNKDNHGRRLDDHEKRLDKLELRPSQKWDALVFGMIGAIATAIVSFFINR